jgi:hypothetical protein
VTITSRVTPLGRGDIEAHALQVGIYPRCEMIEQAREGLAVPPFGNRRNGLSESPADALLPWPRAAPGGAIVMRTAQACNQQL